MGAISAGTGTEPTPSARDASSADSEPTMQKPLATPLHAEAREHAYLQAVLGGNFEQAEELFALLSNPRRALLQRTHLVHQPVLLHHRADWIDRLLTHIGGEGMKGPWALQVGDIFVLFAYDEWLTQNPRIGEEAKKVVVALGLSTGGSPRRARSAEEA